MQRKLPSCIVTVLFMSFGTNFPMFPLKYRPKWNRVVESSFLTSRGVQKNCGVHTPYVNHESQNTSLWLATTLFVCLWKSPRFHFVREDDSPELLQCPRSLQNFGIYYMKMPICF